MAGGTNTNNRPNWGREVQIQGYPEGRRQATGRWNQEKYNGGNARSGKDKKINPMKKGNQTLIRWYPSKSNPEKRVNEAVPTTEGRKTIVPNRYKGGGKGRRGQKRRRGPHRPKGAASSSPNLGGARERKGPNGIKNNEPQGKGPQSKGGEEEKKTRKVFEKYGVLPRYP